MDWFSSFINWTASELPFGGCVDSQPGPLDVCAFESTGNAKGDIAWIGGFRMGPGEMKTISARFALRRPSPAVEFRFDILQYSTVLGRESLVGGQRFSIPRPRFAPSTAKHRNIVLFSPLY